MYDFSATGGGIQHNGFVDATNALGYKIILNASGYSGAVTSCPATLMLVDLLGYHTLTNATVGSTGTKTMANTENVTFDDGTGFLRMIHANDYDTYTPVQFTTAGALPTGLAPLTTYWTIRVDATHSKLATSLTNAIAGTAVAYTNDGTPANTLWVRHPRYTDGKGVQTFITNSVAGACDPVTLQLTYVNAAGTGSRTTPLTLPITTAAAPLLTIPYSGTGVGKYGPFIPLMAGDTGTRFVNNLILSVTPTATAVWNLCYCKPLLTLPLTTIGVAAERDLVNQLPSMPRVYDGACLVWLIYSQLATPNNTAYYGDRKSVV
jgi:hypothetical protein